MADTLPTEQRRNSRESEVEKDAPMHLDLFSGIGGFALAAQWAGFRTVAFCEIDKYCQKVLAQNFLYDSDAGRCEREKSEIQTRRELVIVPDIRNLDGREFAGVDLITGGFPCQPFSVAGKRRGAADDRAIWPQMFRVIREARPAWILGENVPGIIPMELDNVLSDLEGIGYATRTFVIPACAVDARHRRDRIWIIGRRNMGDASVEGLEGYRDTQISDSQGWENEGGYFGTPGGSDSMANSTASGLSFPRLESRERTSNANVRVEQCCRWLPEPDVGRVAHGIPSRVDRLKGLGNAIVPQVAYEILRVIRRLC